MSDSWACHSPLSSIPTLCTSSDFVLVKPTFQQTYPLFYLLPYSFSLFDQILLLVSILVSSLVVFFSFRNVNLATVSWFVVDLMNTVSTTSLGLGLGSLALVPPLASSSSPSPSSSPPVKHGSNKSLRRATSTGTLSTRSHLDGLKPFVPQNAADWQAKHFPGLRNTGNTCFFNSTIQSLASVPALKSYLDQAVESAERWDVPTPVTDALLQLFDQLNTPGKRASCINPVVLVNALRTVPSNTIRSLVTAHQQQDAHELFVLLSEALENEMASILQEAQQQQHEQQAGFKGLIGPSQPWKGKAKYADPALAQTHSQAHVNGNSHPLLPFWPLSSSSSSHHDDPIPQVSPFSSLTAQRTSCLDCGYMEAIRHFSSAEFSLSVPGRHQSTRISQLTGTAACSIEECLEIMCQLEPVDWVCWRCSLTRTSLRLKAEVNRLEGVAASSASQAQASLSTPPPPSSSSALANGDRPDNAKNGSSTTHPHAKMSTAKKKRLREARTKEARVSKVLMSGLSEDEIASLETQASSPFARILSGIQLDRQPSRMSTKQLMLSRSPQVLVLHLNRSSYTSFSAWGGPTKNNRQVIFDEWLDIGPFCLGGQIGVDGRKGMDLEQEIVDSMSPNALFKRNHKDTIVSCKPKTMYRLCSIVVHYGGHSFGHYVSYRRAPTNPVTTSLSGSDVETGLQQQQRQNDTWLRISDDSVQLCSIDQVLDQNPFMLFYQQCNPSSLLTPTVDPQQQQQQQQVNGYLPLIPIRPRIVHRWDPTTTTRSTTCLSTS